MYFGEAFLLSLKLSLDECIFRRDDITAEIDWRSQFPCNSVDAHCFRSQERRSPGVSNEASVPRRKQIEGFNSGLYFRVEVKKVGKGKYQKEEKDEGNEYTLIRL